MSELGLAARAKAGSLQAFEGLVTLYEAKVYNFVLQRCGRAEDAQEITQDTFLKAYQSMQRFDCSKAFGPWLFTIARRKCIDRFRAAPMHMTSALPEQSDMHTPSEALVRAEEAERVWTVARRVLSPAQYETLWLRYVEDMSVGEISTVVRKTKTHVKILLFRARRALARQMPSESELQVVVTGPVRLATPAKIPRTLI